MKSIVKFAFVLFFSIQFSGCSSSDVGTGTTCIDTYYCTNSGTMMQTCCSDSSCYYDAGSQNFYCSGTYCNTAATNVANYCLAKTSAKSEFDLATSLGIEKANNIQLQKSIDGMYIDLGKELQQQ